MKHLASIFAGLLLASNPVAGAAATYNGSVNARNPDSITTNNIISVTRQGALVAGGAGCSSDVTGRYLWGADGGVVLNGTTGNAFYVQCGTSPLLTVDLAGNLSTNGSIRMATSNLKGYVPPLINGDGSPTGPFSQIRAGQVNASCTQTATPNAFYSCYAPGAGPTFVFGGATFTNTATYKCVASIAGENYGNASLIPLTGATFRLAILAYDHSPAFVNYVCAGS